jgi:hypothetical protein
MEVNQIASIVNAAAQQTLGATAIDALDGDSLVSLGDQIMRTDRNTDVFWRKIADRIGRVDNKYKLLKRADRFSTARTEVDWGIALQKNQVRHIREVEESASWSQTQTDPYRYNDVTDFTSTVYHKIAAYQTKPVVAPRDQLKRTFLNFAEMGSFLSMLDADMNNAFTLSVNDNERLARNVALELAFRDGQSVNLGTEYNAAAVVAGWTPLPSGVTVEQAALVPTFTRFAAERIKRTKKWLTDETAPSRLFNGIGADRWTEDAVLRLDVLSSFASAMETYMLSDTYHKELAELKGYREVRAWQASGNTMSLADASKVEVSLTTGTSPNPTPMVNPRANVVAFMYDHDRVGTLVRDERVLSWWNPDCERQNTKKAAEIGYYVDRSEQGVVFYIDVA